MTRKHGEFDSLEIRGASEHNLKSIDLNIPKNRLTVFTGVSGSGKSSLAFDTLFAEGQRRYIESLSAYARQFLGQLEKPAYESIRGLSPTISIEQRSAGSNPRSTVGTITEISDYLRVLFARAGHQYCHICSEPVSRLSSTEIVDELEKLPGGFKYSVLAPLVADRKGAHKEIIQDMLSQGYPRFLIDGEVHLLSQEIPALDPRKRHSVSVIVDRLVAGPGHRRRLTDTVETALRAGHGTLVIMPADGTPELVFSEKLACPSCGVGFPDLEPQRFSFNSPQGCCPDCNGLGTIEEIDAALIVPDESLSINEGAIIPWGGKGAPGDSSWSKDVIRHLAGHFNIPMDKAWKDLSRKHKDILLFGTGGKKFTVKWKRRGGRGEVRVSFEGLANQLMRRYRDTQSDAARAYYSKFLKTSICPACKGSRLRPESLAVLVAGYNLGQIGGMPINRCIQIFEDWSPEGAKAVIAGELKTEILSRLRFLRDVGLGYLTLDRSAPSLSGGEAQRIRLAGQIGGELTGVLYVLDEPSIGLHPVDNVRLLRSLFHLRDLGNTVIVVEHDRDTILAADHVVDFGPGAGENGGRIIAQGSPEKIRASKKSLTGRYLSGELEIPVPPNRRPGTGYSLVLHSVSHNNLRSINVEIPLGLFVCVTGVSGAGKSSLVQETLLPALKSKLHGSLADVGAHKGIEGLEFIDKVISIDQSPIGRTPRSNPATYVKVYDHIRRVFAEQKESRINGYSPGRFSFNVKGGRCEACRGDGLVKVEMHFLPDVFVPCDVCKGKRFNEATLRVRYRGLNIHEILKLTVSQALEHFEAHSNIKRILDTVARVGLGYLGLGQPSPSLSGGEAQRIKLSRELAKRSTGRTLYILDEPTTGLHFDDIKKLVSVLQNLVDNGNTVLVVEHNPDVIKCADHVIDLGPGGGDAGGEIVCAGTPEEVAACVDSATGRFLAPLLKT